MIVEVGQRALPNVLRAIGRNLLGKFFAQFQPDLAARQISLPPPDLRDDIYFHRLTALLSADACVPERLTHALCTIQEMANPEGLERLQAAVAQAGLNPAFDGDASPEALTVQVWLEAPDILEREHRKQEPVPLTAFQCFSSRVPKDQRVPFVVPDPAALQALSLRVVQWFAQNHHAVHSTRIELEQNIPGQLLFHVRHGDTCRWTRKVGDQKTEFLRFNLEDQERIIFPGQEDELWISARTNVELEFYRQQFGLSLRANRDYFSEPRIYDLHPLGIEGTDALYPGPGGEILKIILRQVQVKWDNGFHEITIASADDFFKCAGAGAGHRCFIPAGGTPTRAAFLIQFADSPWRRSVEICVPGVLKVQRPADLLAVSHWTTARGLCLPQYLTTTNQCKAA